MAWSFADIGDQSGRVALVTGANSGIGEPTARELGRAGARVVIACRSADKAEAALARLRQAAPQGDFFVSASRSCGSIEHQGLRRTIWQPRRPARLIGQ